MKKRKNMSFEKKQRPAFINILIAGAFLSLIVAGCCLKTYPDPVIRFDHEDSEGRMYIPVVNWEDYPDNLFAVAPDLPPCGLNDSASRTWVDIYNCDTDERIYGFCALDDNEGLQDIWFKPNNHGGRVYIVITDRKCDKSYKSECILYGECVDSFPNPVIAYDHTDSEGRVYIPVTNWSDYANHLFRQAPELPPCGSNTNSARTWVEIYDANTDNRIYGFCAFGVNTDLQSIWFKPDTTGGQVYIIMHDRACEKEYVSNTISY